MALRDQAREVVDAQVGLAGAAAEGDRLGQELRELLRRAGLPEDDGQVMRVDGPAAVRVKLAEGPTSPQILRALLRFVATPSPLGFRPPIFSSAPISSFFFI